MANTIEEIEELLHKGYFLVPRELWPYICNKSRIRYLTKGPGPMAIRFHLGGLVTFNGDERIVIKTKDADWSILYDNVENIWKKYSNDAFIEIHMISTDLANKERRLKLLEDKINEQYIDRTNKYRQFSKK